MPNGWGYAKGGKGKGKGRGKLPHRRLHQAIDSYLQPLLVHSIQNTLSERSDALLRRLAGPAEGLLPMCFYVSVKVDETNMIVTSTSQPNALARAGSGETHDQLVGLAIETKTTVFSNYVNGGRVVFNLVGKRLGQVSSDSANLLSDEEAFAKWVYANPILEISDSLSSDAQIIGVLGVEGSDDRSYAIFTDNVFQQEVESIACEVGPYLSLFSSLRQVDRL